LKFTKMHGLGNDFIIIDHSAGKKMECSRLAEKICRRRFSIGADGLIFILPSVVADIKMRIFNSDGSEAEMCGNGIRCFAAHILENGILKKRKMTVETLAGIMETEILEEKDKSGNIMVRVNMGKPRFRRSQIPMVGEDSPGVIDEKIEVDGEILVFSAVLMGNPHCVFFVEEIDDYMVRHIGPLIEKHPLFPKKTNVEFIRFRTPRHIEMRVWERGAGETLACGTGACASVVAGIRKGMLDREVRVTLPGGDLLVGWEDGGNVMMTGPAEIVFKGEYIG